MEPNWPAPLTKKETLAIEDDLDLPPPSRSTRITTGSSSLITSAAREERGSRSLVKAAVKKKPALGLDAELEEESSYEEWGLRKKKEALSFGLDAE